MKLVVGIYGSRKPKQESSGAILDWQNWVIEKVGVPTHVEGRFCGDPGGLKPDKAYTFRRYHSRFDEQIATGNVELLTLTAMKSRPKGYIAFEWDWTASFGFGEGSTGGGPISALGVVLGLGRQSASELTYQYVQAVIPKLCTEYGFAATMPQEFMPAGYAIGLACGGAPKELRFDANAWMSFARKECGKTLRNVFGYNILNSRHLNIDIGGQPLRAWIIKEAYRGRLEPLNGDLFIWTFQQDDDREAFLQWDFAPVVRVREELEQYQLFPWQRLVEQERATAQARDKRDRTTKGR